MKVTFVVQLSSYTSTVMTENQEIPEKPSQGSDGEVKKSADTLREASWPSVLFFIHLNILGLYGIVVLFTSTKFITIAFCKNSLNDQNRFFLYQKLFKKSLRSYTHGNLRFDYWRSQTLVTQDLYSESFS